MPLRRTEGPEVIASVPAGSTGDRSRQVRAERDLRRDWRRPVGHFARHWALAARRTSLPTFDGRLPRLRWAGLSGDPHEPKVAMSIFERVLFFLTDLDAAFMRALAGRRYS